ncbi:MAG: group II intron maturase-specific domain-containing protein [Saprospiraceae bacterium]
MKLPINREKSGIRKPVHFEILGYKYVPTYIQGDRGPQGSVSKYQLVVSEKGWINLKRKLKEITKKSAPKSFDVRIAQIKKTSQGWLQYFRLGSIFGKLRDVDSWVRNRLRLCVWNVPIAIGRKKPERKRIPIAIGTNPTWCRSQSSLCI